MEQYGKDYREDQGSYTALDDSIRSSTYNQVHRWVKLHWQWIRNKCIEMGVETMDVKENPQVMTNDMVAFTQVNWK